MTYDDRMASSSLRWGLNPTVTVLNTMGGIGFRHKLVHFCPKNAIRSSIWACDMSIDSSSCPLSEELFGHGNRKMLVPSRQDQGCGHHRYPREFGERRCRRSNLDVVPCKFVLHF